MKTRRRALFTLLAGTAVLTGCASPQVTDYAQERPLLELDRYFTGRVLAHGVFQKRNGAVARRFTVVMDCHWEGNQGVLDEAFTYSDGSTERRIWRLTKHADSRYTGRPTMWWARPRARPRATPFAGTTPCACRWMARSTRCSLTIGCSWLMTGCCSTAPP